MVETWRPIPGWEGKYEVSDSGRVRSCPHVVTKRDGRQQVVPSRIRAQATDKKGYRHVSLYRVDVAKRYAVHVLVMAAFVGPRPNGADICHGNGDPGDNRLENLRYDSRSNNHRDKRLHGTAREGETNPRARLTANEVRAIRDEYESGQANQMVLARRYCTPQSNISSIVLRRTWRHV